MKGTVMATVRVRCSFEIDVEVPAVDNLDFDIEDNGCPATGVVGAALRRHIEKHEADGTCWACALQGKNEIVSTPASCPATLSVPQSVKRHRP
jgi:hypothetical protein